MNREIEFRGYNKTYSWRYGDYTDNRFDGFESIWHDGYQYEIIPGTLGQYTGLNDKNGKEIYENDIVTDGVLNYVVTFYAGAWCLKSEGGSWHPLYPVAHQREVIGNIYENKDFLK